MPDYALEFTLCAYRMPLSAIKDSLARLGKSLEVMPSGERDEFMVCIVTGDPTLVFDACAELGRIKSVKVKEAGE